MSGLLAGKVWESGLERHLKPVAAVLAGFANDDGSSVFPSIARVARMVGLSERRTQAAVSRLRAIGVLRVELSRGPYRSTHYRFCADALPVDGQLTLWEKFSTVCTGLTGSRQHPKPATSSTRSFSDPSDSTCTRAADAPQVSDLNATETKTTIRASSNDRPTGAERSTTGGSQTDNRTHPETDQAIAAALFDQQLRRLPLRAKLDVWRARAVGDDIERKR